MFAHQIVHSLVLTVHLNDGSIVLDETCSSFEVSAKLILGISNSPAVAKTPLVIS